MSCTFCGHITPHACSDAEGAAYCANFAAARDALIKERDAMIKVQQIETKARFRAARLKLNYRGK